MENDTMKNDSSSQDERRVEPTKLSRRKVLTAIGGVGAAAVSGGMLASLTSPFGGGKSVHASIYGDCPETIDADDVLYHFADGLSEQTVGDKLRITIDVKDFGATGDGVTDDTEAFNDLNAHIASSIVPVSVFIPKGTYIVNPLLCTSPSFLLQLVADFSEVECEGLIKIKAGPDYTIGRAIGSEWYFSVIDIKANECKVMGVALDGNGTATLSGYKSSIVNLRWQGVTALGPRDGVNYHKGNRITKCRTYNNGGQSFTMQWNKNGVIEGCYSYGCSGMGFSRCERSILVHNIAENSHDAPFISNGRCHDILIKGNLSDVTTNGSGIDVTGTTGCIVEGNIIKRSAAWGLLVGYNVQNSNYSENVRVRGNLFESNSQGDVSFPSEICVGSAYTDRAINATDVVIENNTFVLDGSAGAFRGQTAKMAYGAVNVVVRDNEIYGTLSSSKMIFTVSSASSKNISFVRNRWNGDGTPFITTSTTYLGTFAVYDNVGIQLDANAGRMPNRGKENAGTLEMSLNRNIGTSDVDIVTIWLPGGLQFIVLEVCIVQSGSGGVLSKCYVISGYSGTTVSVISDTSTIAATGSNPPVLTPDTAEAGVFRLKISSTGVARATTIHTKLIGIDHGAVSFN